MKNYITENKSGGFAIAVLYGIATGYICLFLSVIIFALVMSLAKIDTSAASLFSIIILIISGIFCGFVSAKKFGSKNLIVGAVSGALFYITVGIISTIITKDVFSSTFIVRLLITVVSSVFGAVFKTFKKSTKYI